MCRTWFLARASFAPIAMVGTTCNVLAAVSTGPVTFFRVVAVERSLRRDGTDDGSSLAGVFYLFKKNQFLSRQVLPRVYEYRPASLSNTQLHFF